MSNNGVASGDSWRWFRVNEFYGRVVLGGNIFTNSEGTLRGGMNFNIGRYPVVFTNNLISGLRQGVVINRSTSYNGSKFQAVEDLNMVIFNNQLTGSGGTEQMNRDQSGLIVTDSTKGMLVYL